MELQHYAAPATIPTLPRTYTVGEVATMTGFSRQTVTRLFENEKGVLVIDRSESMNKRGYRSIRIPQHVYERVVRKVSVQ